ncbi:uncharacterized protein LOC127252489 [Andrographis paniculata]|uniref:uncharacterized protein LOC127252489 n=1 Tax=Andrographis paniculata TaxID=175694 RepID=UPI0021E8A751|nr:uncharacterized protein LOC127252489 [Andrographis paniculata]
MVLRYVDAHGLLKERFIGVVHVMKTSSLTLKYAIDYLFTKDGLSLNQVRGQGYDGASNIRWEFSNLKALILKENNSAYYLHCFAHQLHLRFLQMKRYDKTRDKIQEAICKGEIETGRGLNQELSRIRAEDTRWDSHHRISEGLKVVAVLKYVKEYGDNSLSRGQADGFLKYF